MAASQTASVVRASPWASTFDALQQIFAGDGGRRLELAADERLDGATVMITGCNCGLGKATAVRLAKLGARIIMACRDEVPQAADEIRRLSGSKLVEIFYVDLADFASIHALCDQLRESKLALDMVVLNAAVVPLQARRSVQGLDLMLAVNYVSSVVLLRRLLHDGTVRVAAEPPQRRLRVIFISSEDHRLPNAVDIDKLDQFRDYQTILDMSMYGRGKLLLTTFAFELSRRLNRSSTADGQLAASVFALCPGPMNTNIIAEAPFWIKPLLSVVLWLLFRDPMDAATPVQYLAAARAMENRTHVYLHRLVEKQPAPRVLDRAFAKQLWDKTDQILRDRDQRYSELAVLSE